MKRIHGFNRTIPAAGMLGSILHQKQTIPGFLVLGGIFCAIGYFFFVEGIPFKTLQPFILTGLIFWFFVESVVRYVAYKKRIEDRKINNE